MRQVTLVLALVGTLAGSRLRAGLTPRQIYGRMASGVVFLSSQEGNGSSICGTGMILTADGRVLTNAHVIVDKSSGRPCADIHAFLKPAVLSGDLDKDLADGHTAEVIAYDRTLDLALLRLRHVPTHLTVLRLGDPGVLAPGDETVAIGHPEQGGLWTLTTGVLSAQIKNQGGVQGRDVWQMQTSLNRGNSGGPLFDPRGYVVGVNTAIARRASDGLAITGINFAIKSSSAKAWLAAHGLKLDYGPLPLDDATIAQAYGLAVSVANTDPATAVTAVPTTVMPTAQPTAVAARPEASPVPAAPATPVSGRAPVHFTLDLEQQQRPYTADQVGSYLRKLMKKRDKAMEELDQATSGD